MLQKLFLALAFVLMPMHAEETERPLPKPVFDVVADGDQQAVFAGGCFWGMQGVFQRVKGVKSVVAGYSGGSSASASYEKVSWGNTGHAEAVRIIYDPRIVSYGRLLQVFFSVMDPTTKNYQGPDEGTQYRTAIFTANGDQRHAAEAYIAQLSQLHIFSHPIVTTVSELRGFYPAEAYHQDYLLRHPSDRYIVINDLPKLRVLKRFYPDLYEERPVTIAWH